MTDLSLQLILQPADHAIDGALKNARRYRVGDIVDIWPTENIATLVNGEYRLNDVINPKWGFIHITGVPHHIEVVKRALLAETWGTESAAHLDETVLRRRAWHIPPSEVPIAVRNALLADREITVSYTQARQYIRKKIIQGGDKYGTMPDDISTQLTDGDLNG